MCIIAFPPSFGEHHCTCSRLQLYYKVNDTIALVIKTKLPHLISQKGRAGYQA